MSAYRQIVTKVGVVLALAMVFTVSDATRSEAAFIAYICATATCSGGGDTIVTDNGVGDGLAVTGQILATAVVGGVVVTVNNSTSKPLFGSAGNPAMDMSFTANGLGTVYLYASDTGFTGVGGLHANLNDTTGGAVTGQLYGGSSNANLDLSSPLLSPALSGTGSFNVFGNTGVVGMAVNPYSLTLGVRIVNTVPGVATSGDISFTAVPEPTSLVLLGMGLFGGAGAARRKQLMKRLFHKAPTA
jgi:hypothetical protein